MSSSEWEPNPIAFGVSSSERNYAMVTDRKAGMSYADIGRKYGVTKQNANKICKRYGV